MGKVYYISRNVGLALLVLAATALATIIALSVAYHRERAKSLGRPGEPSPASGGSPSPSGGPPTPSTAEPKEPWDRYRLPDSLVPVRYNVTLWPRLKPDDDGLYIFSGHSEVVFRCAKETDLIIMHCHQLNLTAFHGVHAKLQGLAGVTPPAILRSWTVEKTEFLVLQLSGNLSEGASYSLRTEFQGELADDLQGFYRSEYVEDNEKKVLATTQMQATYARKAFPCFDEPAMKAVFDVSIIHPPHTVALSNGREKGVADAVMEGRPVKVTTFEETEKMSTYLLAFLVCEFASIQRSQGPGTQVRVWARSKAIEDGHGDYAYSVTGKILQFYERYYNIKYPLPKADQIAVPDFHAGAMENWGLVMYRESALLFDPKVSSTSSKQTVATIIAHELAHQWFGNLVSMKWWNDLWLNEGFASYMECLGADFAEPTWKIRDAMILHKIQGVFALDALASSHPLSRPEHEVNSPEEISEMFSAISYSKGAAVLRMLSGFLGEHVFVDGLTSYLNRFSFGSTVYTDLWDHLQEEATKQGVRLPYTVQAIMDPWTLQMGFPVVTIDTHTGSITQKYFLLDPESVVDKPSKFNYTWIVPIKWMKNGVEQEQHWLLSKSETYGPMKLSGDNWLLANNGMYGYYRVNYDPDNWERLVTLLETDHQAMSVMNRAQIIDNAFNLGRAKLINNTVALRITKYLHKERDYIPWESALRNLNYYYVVLDRTEVFGALEGYLKKQIQPLFEHFRAITDNWTRVPEAHTDQYNQINAIRVACRVGVPGCRELTSAWFREWMENPSHNPIHPNLKSTVYCMAIASGGVEEWDFAWRMYINTTMASEASHLRLAMSCTKLPWLLIRYLDYSIDPKQIRKQDAISVIQHVVDNSVGLPLAWNFIRDKWSYILQQFGKGSFALSGLITGISKRFSTPFELQELKKFKEDKGQNGFGSASMELEQAIERTTANIKWLSENKGWLMRWFSEESR